MSCSPDAPLPPRDASPVGVVGLGLVGGSAARALVLANVPVIGTATSADDRRDAARAGVRVVDTLDALVDALPADATVLVAVPVGALAAVCATLAARLGPDALVLHAAGLQGHAATGLAALDDAARRRVLGTHPIAGSHDGGFASSRAFLFHDAVVSTESRATPAQRTRIEALWTRLGAARVEWRDADAHDRTMAWVSHLPQLAAVALAAALDGADVPASAGGPGLRGATRLAASPPALWADLLRHAPAETRRALDALIAEASALRAALDAHAAPDALPASPSRGQAASAPAARLHPLWERARRWRAGLSPREASHGTR